MERKNGTAADGGVKYCIWYAGNEVGHDWKVWRVG